MIVARVFSGKRYAVLGLARSGLASVAALIASGAEVQAWDDREAARDAAAALGATIGDPLVTDLTGFVGVVVSPGVPINRHPIAAHAKAAHVPVIGDIELFAQARAELPPHTVVGITGTNGKSTTTALIHHILETTGARATLGGNIGLPILGQQPLAAGGIYVLELSSYQIDLTNSLDCDVAVLINITPDHLDRYDDFADYAAAKERLFALQHADKVAVIATDDDRTRMIASRINHRLHRVGAASVGPEQLAWPALQGPHNAQNAACAIAVAKVLGLDDAAIAAGLESYVGLRHRMEYVGSIGGVGWYNDSKATNAASSAPALAAFQPAPEARLHWIVGGQAKGDGLGACRPFFGNVACAYTIGESGPQLAEELASAMPVVRSGTLSDAVAAASGRAIRGDIVLMSPACASFDQFRDFEDRGDTFRALVKGLGA